MNSNATEFHNFVLQTYRKHPGHLNNEELLEILTKLTCPMPCVGYVNETGWHKGCIDRAERAATIIRELYSNGP